jgi:hypothetical protein
MKHQPVKEYGSGVALPAFINSALIIGERLHSRSGRFTTEKDPRCLFDMRLIETIADLNAMEQRNILWPCQEPNHFSISYPVTKLIQLSRAWKEYLLLLLLSSYAVQLLLRNEKLFFIPSKI